MVLEVKPSSPLAMTFPPPGGKSHKVKTGENWTSIAKDHGIDTWDLIEFNFPAVIGVAPFDTKCRQVNWSLREHVGCTRSNDGDNYSFDSSDSPGLIYIPTSPKTPGGKCDPWELTEAEKREIRAAGGEALLEWAQKAPTDDVEVKEFAPDASLRKDFKALLAWKSCEPALRCVAAPRARLQYVLMLRDDEGYWRERSPSEREATIRRSTQEAMLRAYRWRILTLKQCPMGARMAEIEFGKALILTMITGLILIMPTPKIPGPALHKAIGSVVGFLAKKLNEFLESE